MEFEPGARMLTCKEIMGFTGLTKWQAQSLLNIYGVIVGGWRCMSVRKLKSLIADGTVEKHKQRHGGRPAKKEDE